VKKCLKKTSVILRLEKHGGPKMNVREKLFELVETAKKIHTQERRITLESVRIVGELDRQNAAVNVGMSSERFAEHIGLTPNQFWKRAQAARVMRSFPQTKAMVESGETEISCLALIAPRITEANAELILREIKNKSRRDVQGLLSRVTFSGELLNREPEVEFRVTLKESEFALLDRGREVLAHGGHMPGVAEILVKALGDLLEKRDPMKKAERAAIRAERVKPPSPEKEQGTEEGERSFLATVPCSEKQETKMTIHTTAPSPEKATRVRRASIPQTVRHLVWLRDGGQCTWQNPNGTRCKERAMLELDHVKMWRRGGRHQADNLTLRCRCHNQFAAFRQLGTWFMERKRRRRSVS
jgi:hypothetical protein